MKLLPAVSCRSFLFSLNGAGLGATLPAADSLPPGATLMIDPQRRAPFFLLRMFVVRGVFLLAMLGAFGPAAGEVVLLRAWKSPCWIVLEETASASEKHAAGLAINDPQCPPAQERRDADLQVLVVQRDERHGRAENVGQQNQLLQGRPMPIGSTETMRAASSR